jgi:uncharacterized membrane protein YphA (DoxX/SURF4 family)
METESATATANYISHTPTAPRTTMKTDLVASILRWTYGIVPIVSGVDKFTDLLTNWKKYLASAVADIIPFSVSTFMNIFGVIEIITGIVVLVRPRIGALIGGVLLIVIAINLLFTGQYYDVAVRDTMLAIGAICLHILCNQKGKAN